MKAHTLSVVVGSSACNAKCPMCISKMTSPMLPAPVSPDVLVRNLRKSCVLAAKYGVSTALITGKGEPTLYKDALKRMCAVLDEYFPVIELQTNGYLLWRGAEGTRVYRSADLSDLYSHGLTTVSLSIAHHVDDLNNEIFQFPTVLKLREIIDHLHQCGFTVRLSCVLISGFIESIVDIARLVDFCKATRVEQLTIRPIHAEESEEYPLVTNWARKYTPSSDRMLEIHNYFAAHAEILLELAHGATVYDYKGQNVCLATCMTRTTDPNNIRQLIFFSDGHLRYDWVYPGAILI